MTKMHSIVFMRDKKEQYAYLDLMGFEPENGGNTVNGFSLDGAATH